MCAVPRRSLRLTTERLTIRPLAARTSPSSPGTATCPTSPATRTGRFPTHATSPTRWSTTPRARDADARPVAAAGGRPTSDDRLLGDVAVWLDEAALLAMIGYTLAPESQGQGYAVEAVKAVVDWLFTRAEGASGGGDVWIPQNLASARVLERNGFRYIGTARSAALVRGVWSDDARFEILAAEWRAWKRRPGRPRRVELVEITPEIGAPRRRARPRLLAAPLRVERLPVVRRRARPAAARRDSRQPWFRAIVGRRRTGRIHDGRRADAEPAASVPLAADGRLAPSRSRHRPRRDRGAGAAARGGGRDASTAELHGRRHRVAGAVLPTARIRTHGTVNEWGETEMIAPLDRLLPTGGNGVRPVQGRRRAGRASADQSAST